MTTQAKKNSRPTFWKTFRRNPMGIVGLVMLAITILAAVFAPWISPYDPKAPIKLKITDIYAPPSAEHLLGTDDAAKDVLSSFLYGSRVSLFIGFFASFISVALGGVIGIIAGYYGGRLENFLMRITDILLVIPTLPLMIVIVAVTKPSMWNIILVIGLLGWTGSARLVRSQTLTLKQRKFVLRARAIGSGSLHIIWNHILPLVFPLIAANTVLVISSSILSESSLSFLGLGDPTTLSWGQMLHFAFARGSVSAHAWWVLYPPGLGIVWVTMACTLLGNGLEQVFNPRLELHHLSAGKDMLKNRKPLPASAASLMPGKDALLEGRNISIDYISRDNEAFHAVEDVSFTLHSGEVMGLVGESGCGKTTLALSLMRLLPAAGRIVRGATVFSNQEWFSLSEREMRDVRWKNISMIFQGAMNALNPVRTVGDQIAEAIIRHNQITDKTTVDNRVIELFDMVGIPRNRKDSYPHQYSGGMRQRAIIAMALACSPQVVIADEPTTALDVMIQAQILDLLANLQKRLGLSVILVTHDLGVIAEVCDSVLVMYGGVTAEYASVDTIYNEPKHPYTQQLLGAFPDLSNPVDKLISIPGYPPRLNELPPGCRFAPRCNQAFDRCHVEQPPLHRISAGHYASCHLALEMERMSEAK